MKYRSDPQTENAATAPTCWHREAPALCLRIELPRGELYLFPYQQLVTASLIRADDGEVLRLSFASHEVEITGHNLRDLLVALQDYAVKWLRTTPTRYQTLVDRDSGTVSAIRITTAE